MAVTTIDAVVTDVMFMTELDRLFALDVLPCVPSRTIQFNGHPQQCDDDEYRTVDSNLRQSISAVVENLWHWKARTLPNRSRIANWATKMSRGSARTSTDQKFAIYLVKFVLSN